MTTPTIVDFRRNMKGEESAPAAERVLKGDATHPRFTLASKQTQQKRSVH